MGLAQHELNPSPQGDLFSGVSPSGPTPYQVKREHVLNRLVEMLAEMSGAEHWPWDETRRDLYRSIVWPHLLRLLPETEAERWRADLETEAARLDVA